DVIVVGAGLAGLVATAELADAGRRVILLEQEPAPWLGGQAFWSFGGLFLVNSPEQRRLGVRDSQQRARQDWMVTAGFDRPEDQWPRKWAEAYIAFAAGEKRSWLRAQGAGRERGAGDGGRPCSRLPVGEFEFQADAVIVTSGGLGGNHGLVRTNWPARLGAPPQQMLSGVPAHVDGRMLAITERAGG